ncbi:degV family protein [Alkaliphilus metalliredigens QYMF]|uniref:DegV family protein n=1 Tax=Alkaliphilus metalliredigens (strain QYMF) TaxID=293826 RepID=A6TSW0_ALKMQ|nr:DegV family protein [Alkaliphilus metalliredigens]ABR49278.1 degV family protein [Alkaliphilus metalliredigens QYMF]
MKIVTDSSCDIPRELIEKYNIDVVPLQIEIDDKNYSDGVDITHQQFYEKMKTSLGLPKTSQPSPQSFVDVYQDNIKKYGQILSIHLSSKLSGTCHSAMMAKEMVGEEEGRIETFDTLSGSFGVGAQVLEACHLVEQGLDMDTIIERLNEYREQTRVVVYLETLENAVKGGRVSKPKEFVANLLNLKPIVHVEEGYVRVLKNIRGKKKGMKFLLEEIEKKNIDYKDRVIGITHCDCLEDALILKEEIIKKFNPAEVLVTTMGPVIGTHAGIGGILICF